MAGFDGDHNGVGDRFAKEIAQRYGFPVIQTCLRVTKSVTTAAQDSSFEEGSAAWLLVRYKSDLILWGKVAVGPQVELHVCSAVPLGIRTFKPSLSQLIFRNLSQRSYRAI